MATHFYQSTMEPIPLISSANRKILSFISHTIPIEHVENIK